MEEKSYYSSSNFKRITEKYGLKESDYWEPSRPYTQHNLCDYIQMTRYRLKNQEDMGGPRVSWVLIPITMGGITYAYFVVMESRDFMDFYDEYSIRIAYLMLQGVYEQIMLAWDMGNIGFENFVHLLMNNSDQDQQKLIYQAGTQEIDMNVKYNCILFHQCNEKCNAQAERKSFINALRKTSVGKSSRLAFLDKKDGVIFLETVQGYGKEQIEAIIKEYEMLLAKECKDAVLEFGVCREVKTLIDICQSVTKCWKALEMGKILYPERRIWHYDMLGILAWIQVPDNALEDMLSKYKDLLKEPKNVELLLQFLEL